MHVCFTQALQSHRRKPAAVEAIIALILAGLIFRTGGTWAITRLAILLVVVYAIFLDFTPLRYGLEPLARWIWVAVAGLWLINVVLAARARKGQSP
jgi:hypothetical protein